jgi:hypothetical protein
MTLTWKDLFLDTVRDPEAAGRAVMEIAMSRRDVWLAVIAVAALNAVFSTLLGLLSPAPPPDAQSVPVISLSPLPQALLIGGLLVLLAHVLTWVGRMFGGTGQIDDMLKLMIWMQVVAMVLQAANLVILLALPLLGGFLVIVIVVIMLRVLISFVKVGHGFDGLLKASLVLFASFIGMVIGLSLFLALIGVGNLGGQTGV